MSCLADKMIILSQVIIGQRTSSFKPQAKNNLSLSSY